ncbi:ABC transporter substrate-binding protein [Gracilibacillus caseinilyticus]|uniref:ABC transporter substrate-binding protein n=1 Tax=Gracilibacillus caseinilyticus TaxID=2932256 RepID=A0ABY4EZP1_9BACI|nr:ABC transporter substrate-binding protein [Gracilibacillus caseinilyticus]UOQ49869.1 ABC transporter substrate-binding protein [Gracilibacillus caseinilyticus]
MRKSSKLMMLFIVMIAITLIGCSNNAEESAGATEIPENPEDVSGEITVWAWSLEADFLNSIIEDFNQTYPNVTVNINKQGPDQIFQRLVTGLGSGQESQLPDLVQIQDTDIASFTSKFPDSFVNLSEVGFSEHDGSFAESKQEMVKDADGNYIAFPRDLGPVGVFYRKDIFEQAGVDAESIKTWDDYIEAGEVIMEETGVPMLGLALNQQVALARFMIHQQESFYFTDEGELNVGSDELLKAAGKIKEMSDKGITTNVTDSEGQMAAIKNDGVATVPNSVWYNGSLMDQAPELSGEWGTFALPSFEEGGVRAANSGGSSFAIPNSSSNKEAAYVFGEFLSTNVDMEVKGLQEFGLFPSLEAAYDDPVFEEGLEYFDGEKFYQKFADIAVNIPQVTYTGDYPEVDDTVNEEMANMLLNDGNPEEMQQRLVERIEASTGKEDVN